MKAPEVQAVIPVVEVPAPEEPDEFELVQEKQRKIPSKQNINKKPLPFTKGVKPVVPAEVQPVDPAKNVAAPLPKKLVEAKPDDDYQNWRFEDVPAKTVASKPVSDIKKLAEVVVVQQVIIEPEPVV